MTIEKTFNKHVAQQVFRMCRVAANRTAVGVCGSCPSSVPVFLSFQSFPSFRTCPIALGVQNAQHVRNLPAFESVVMDAFLGYSTHLTCLLPADLKGEVWVGVRGGYVKEIRRWVFRKAPSVAICDGHRHSLRSSAHVHACC